MWRSNERNVCSARPGGHKSYNGVSAGVVPCQGTLPQAILAPGGCQQSKGLFAFVESFLVGSGLVPTCS